MSKRDNNMSYWQKDINCDDVNFQEYKCAYHIYLPWLCKFPWESDDKKKPKLVSIDKCLLPEIISLWEQGIKTTGCCCGHGKSDPFIEVSKEDILKMKELGYTVQFNPLRPEAEDEFYPKTKLKYEKSKCTEYA